MPDAPLLLASLANPRVKAVVRLRRRSHRDKMGLLLIEGYREVLRALDNGHAPEQLFFCPPLFLGGSEGGLLERCRAAGAGMIECTAPVFRKISYRDRPDGLLAVARQLRRRLDELTPPPDALVVVAEAVEKPGNLGTILRSADACGVHAVIVCDRCTDIHNPNVVRASIGTLFALPVVEATTAATLQWLDRHRIRVVAAAPGAEISYTEADLAGPTAIVLGTEQVGLSETWLGRADAVVRIPMLGQADSLNVAQAATVMLYEAVRQRAAASGLAAARSRRKSPSPRPVSRAGRNAGRKDS